MKYLAVDVAGNAEAVNSQLITIDTGSGDATAPTSTIKCNATTCGSSYYTASVSVTLTATDGGGSGVAQIVYTTYGSDPSQSNGTVYAGAFTLSATATVKYRAYDNAGNAEATNSQLIQVDSVAPTSTMSCNGNPCGSGWFNADGFGHSRRHRQQRRLGCLQDPLHDQRYDADGDDRQRLHGRFTVSTSGTTVKYRAFDVAGNAETTNSQLLQIDTVAPSSTIRCNGTTCAAGFYSAAVSVTLTATDVGGSGVSQIVYTTDGSDPRSRTAPSTRARSRSPRRPLSSTAPTTSPATLEPINSALIQVDLTPPSTTLNCAASPCSGAPGTRPVFRSASPRPTAPPASPRSATRPTAPCRRRPRARSTPRRSRSAPRRRSTTAPTTTPATWRTTRR